MSLPEQVAKFRSGPLDRLRKLSTRGLLVQSLSLGMGRGSGKLLSFIGFVLTARALGPKSYGALAFAMSVASLLIFLPNMGADPYYTREVARGRECRRGLLRRILTLKVAGSAAFLLLYPLAFRFTSERISGLTVAFLAAAFILICFAETWRSVLITAERAGAAGILDSLQALVFLLAVVLLVRAYATAEMAALAFAASQLASVAVGAVLVWRLLKLYPSRPPSDTWRSLLASTLPLMAIWLFSDLYLRVDTAMLYFFRGETETGYYAASYRLVEGVCAAALVLCAVVLPRLSKEWDKGAGSWESEWQRSYTILLWFVTLPVLLFWALPGQVIGILYGSQFMPSALSLKVLGPATAILCFGYLQGSALYSVGLQRSQLGITAAGLAANVCLNLWLIPRFGGVGAAWSTLLSAIVYISLAQYRLHRALRNRRSGTAEPGEVVPHSASAEREAATCAILLSSAAIGGAERYLVELAMAMTHSPLRPAVINLKGSLAYRDDLDSHAVPVHPGIMPGRFEVLGVIRLLRLLRWMRPDVLLINSNRQAMWLGLIVGRLCHVPLLLIYTHDHLSGHVQSLKAAAARADGIIAASPRHRAALCREHGLDARRVFVVYPGIDLGRTRILQPRPARLLAGSPVVGIVAALRPEKDHTTFLRAAAAIKAEVPGARFRIVGDGPRKSTLRKLASDLGIANSTEFAGWKAVDHSLLSQLDILVLSSASEVFPAVILEAFSAGVPVVATDVGSVADLLSSPQCGLLVPPHDPAALAEAVVTLLKDQAWARHLAGAALRKAEFFSADRFCADIVAAFARIRVAKSIDFVGRKVEVEKMF